MGVLTFVVCVNRDIFKGLETKRSVLIHTETKISEKNHKFAYFSIIFFCVEEIIV